MFNEYVVFAVQLMQSMQLSEWFLVDWANIIVQRAIEHGLLEHYRRDSSYIYRIRHRSKIVVRNDANTSYTSAVPLGLGSYFNLMDMCVVLLILSLVMFGVEVVFVSGWVADWLWAIIK